MNIYFDVRGKEEEAIKIMKLYEYRFKCGCDVCTHKIKSVPKILNIQPSCKTALLEAYTISYDDMFGLVPFKDLKAKLKYYDKFGE
jgi:hypothetical protein